MLDNNLKNQLAQYFDLLKTAVTIGLSAHNDENSKKVREFVEEVVALSDKISLVEKDLPLSPSFEIKGSFDHGSCLLYTSDAADDCCRV